jgi:cytoskeletal protein RodZ
VEAFAQFGQVQLLGFYVLALLFFAVLLITVFSRSESKPVTDESKFESARPVPAPQEATTESQTDTTPDTANTTSADPDAVTTPTEESSTVATGVKTDEPAVIAPVETKA